MKRKIITTSLLVSCALICFAAVTGLAGKWKGSIKTADGDDISLTYNFNVDGDKLTGTIFSPSGELKIYDGKIINEKDFTFKVDVNDETVPSTGKFYGDSVVVVALLDGQKVHSVLKKVADKN
ncbi:glycoside hydrolase [Mucilaginibacter corticis]|uniref:Glycoside hydrolase n=1 Tax=Mucilaginibacter corticis TaxID=2597670 RepID=A0A556MFT0_9SPHI|nr:glycoside hydrolase [Mucilaginibacter corticis]TSJ38753.1 glycoside hydrolase [Mucilaginibacter corticis]